MKYTLTKPCAKCPFRTDIRPYLRSARVEEIDRALVRGDFACHETIDLDENGETFKAKDSKHCAGALILLEKLERPSQMMRIAERLGLYDRRKLKMNAPVFDSFEDMAEAQPE